MYPNSYHLHPVPNAHSCLSAELCCKFCDVVHRTRVTTLQYPTLSKNSAAPRQAHLHNLLNHNRGRLFHSLTEEHQQQGSTSCHCPCLLGTYKVKISKQLIQHHQFNSTELSSGECVTPLPLSSAADCCSHIVLYHPPRSSNWLWSPCSMIWPFLSTYILSQFFTVDNL